MGLLSDLKEPPKRDWGCAVRSLAATLDKADAEILLDAVLNPAWQYYTLEQELQKRGLRLSQSTIKRHRLKNCSCWRADA